MNPLPTYLLTAISEYDEAAERETTDTDELASAFERMKEAIGRAIVDAEGEAA